MRPARSRTTRDPGERSRSSTTSYGRPRSRSSSLLRGLIRVDRRSRVQQHLLENGQVFHIAPAPQGGDAAVRLRPVVLNALRDRDQLGLLEHLQVPVEVAVRQGAQLLQVPEQQSLRVGNERREHAQASALVNDTVQPIVGKTRSGAFLADTLIQVFPHIRTEAPRRPTVGRFRMEYPWSRAITSG